ncbi:MAG: polyprenol monophosphomannose synthase [Acidobacteria bacterium]|nr:polyprenol monophosphomannose synthase [Acidobacteriota bacterium]
MQYPLKPLVIIPTYNERVNISHLIPEVLHTDERLHVLVVDDNSPDHTGDAVLELKENNFPDRIDLHTRPAKLGLGSAYVYGFKWGIDGGYDFVIQMDADWSHNPADIKTMLKFACDFDFVVASRYVKGGGTLNWGLGRKFLSKFASVYSRFILGSNFSDFTGGFNGWSSELLRAVKLDSLRSDGYSFQIELKYLADRHGYKHIEFPITFTERRAGTSKMSSAIALEAVWRIWKFRLDWHKSGSQRQPR